VQQDKLEGILTVRGLSSFYGERQVLFDVAMTVRSREGLVTTWRGEIRYKGEPLATNARARPEGIRRELQYIFQSPYSSLNPRRSVGQSIAAPLQDLFGLKGRAANERIERALSEVLLPLNYASRYPDQLSGGERQRVAIARALICEPKVLICDEITSALDVSVQASIVRLLERLQKEHGLAVIFVTHNLALVRSIAHRVTVMHQGRIVETGDCADVLDNPREPYTRTLLMDTPTLSIERS
jgi:peptide/nickel transport system ATP-binding protein